MGLLPALLPSLPWPSSSICSIVAMRVFGGILRMADLERAGLAGLAADLASDGIILSELGLLPALLPSLLG